MSADARMHGGAHALAPRTDFPLLAARPDLVYLDSAATAQKPRAVLDAIQAYYTTTNANPHRGAYALSAAATQAPARVRAPPQAAPRDKILIGFSSTGNCITPGRRRVGLCWSRQQRRIGHLGKSGARCRSARAV